MKTRVVVVDDHASIRQMLAVMIQREGAYEVVGEAGTGFTALKICRKLKPQVVILDLMLPEMNGVETLVKLRGELPQTQFLIYSGAVSRELTIQALRAKPHGFVHKSDDWSVFIDALKAVTAGGSYFTPFATRMLDHHRSESARPHLTERERLLLQMIAEGMSNKEMADRLDISVKTIEHHRSQVMLRLDMHDVATLTRYAVQLGIVAAEV
jgi:DNA-binding NarL/FixJ family response regulator